MAGFIAGLGIDLSDSYFGTFAREQDGTGATDPGTGAGGEGYLACEPCDLAAFFDCLFTTWATWATRRRVDGRRADGRRPPRRQFEPGRPTLISPPGPFTIPRYAPFPVRGSVHLSPPIPREAD